MEIIPDRKVILSYVDVDRSKVKKVFLGSNVNVIGFGCFYNFYDLEYVEFSKNMNLKFIQQEAFKQCSKLKLLDIPDSVKKIGACSFLGCKNLEKVNISNDFLQLNESSFFGCSKLKEVIFNFSVFYNSNYLCGLYDARKIILVLDEYEVADKIYMAMKRFKHCKNLKNVVVVGNGGFSLIKARLACPVNVNLSYMGYDELKNYLASCNGTMKKEEELDNNIIYIGELKKEIDDIIYLLPCDIGQKINKQLDSLIKEYEDSLNEEMPVIGKREVNLSFASNNSICSESLLIMRLEALLNNLKSNNYLIGLFNKVNKCNILFKSRNLDNNDNEYMEIINNILDISDNFMTDDRKYINEKISDILDQYEKIIKDEIDKSFDDIIRIDKKNIDYDLSLKRELNDLLDRVINYWDNNSLYIGTLDKINKGIDILFFETEEINESPDIVLNTAIMVSCVDDSYVKKVFMDIFNKYKEEISIILDKRRNYLYGKCDNISNDDYNILVSFDKELLGKVKYLNIYYQISNCIYLFNSDINEVKCNNNGLDYGRAIQEVVLYLKEIIFKLDNKNKEEKIKIVDKILKEYKQKVVRLSNEDKIVEEQKHMLSALSRVQLEIELYIYKVSGVKKRKKSVTSIFRRR